MSQPGDESESMYKATPEPRRPTDRSPNYPVNSLKEAIGRAKELWAVMKRSQMGVAEAAEKAWGFSRSSSGGRMLVSALVKFGLLEETGRGAERRVRLAHSALRIILDSRPDSPDRDVEIERAALLPRIHKELWRKWPGGLPPDPEVRFYLMTERGFTELGAESLIREYKETLAFARLPGSNTNGPGEASEAPENEGTPPEAGPAPPQPHAAGAAQPGQPETTSRPAPLRRQSMQAGIKEDVFTLDEGQVVIQWPERLSRDSFEDFENWLLLIIRKVKRSVRNESEAESESGAEG